MIPKLPESVQALLCGLKRRVLSDFDQPMGKIYEEGVKKFVSNFFILISNMLLCILDVAS